MESRRHTIVRERRSLPKQKHSGRVDNQSSARIPSEYFVGDDTNSSTLMCSMSQTLLVIILVKQNMGELSTTHEGWHW